MEVGDLPASGAGTAVPAQERRFHSSNTCFYVLPRAALGDTHTSSAASPAG